MLRYFFAFICLGNLGGFFAYFVFPKTGALLSNVEFPILAETQVIALPDGGTLAALLPLNRIQRYDLNGRFERGWFVHAAGGMFSVSLMTPKKIAACSVRGRNMEVFDLDGLIIEPPSACDWGSYLRPPLINTTWTLSSTLPQIRRVGSLPCVSVGALLLLPFWHPFVAWLMFIIGGMAWKWASSRNE